MKQHYLYLLLTFFFVNCTNERVLLLPEIDNAEVTEVLDVSPAYIFYDESKPDSTLLNRKNLISTTNWLVNVDKRLSLRQVIPHIKFLQDKKRNAQMHKNENAKNYFTCNDTSMSNLGFIEFTDVYFFTEKSDSNKSENICYMTINNLNDISFSTSLDLNISLSRENFENAMVTIQKEYGGTIKIVYLLNSDMSFQNYITLKNTLLPFKDRISNNEFIY
ncbi:hypothetical protein [Winogradskyella sp. A2]|uniref:hypothetical protein n=1 Tax=Winogradskyella sp. A2 TaxID=3366944 RepID=UPI00398C5018